MNKLSIFSIVAIAISAFLFTFSQTGSESLFPGREKNYPMLKPGDKIDDMVITTGAENAFPLWTICSPKKVDDHSINADCSELSICANLAIGQACTNCRVRHSLQMDRKHTRGLSTSQWRHRRIEKDGRVFAKCYEKASPLNWAGFLIGWFSVENEEIVTTIYHPTPSSPPPPATSDSPPPTRTGTPPLPTLP
jgi:hypothetical protein